MKTRRQFIIEGISGFTACFMAPEIAKQITNHCANTGQPFLEAVRKPDIKVYADLCSGKYTLTLDHPLGYQPPRMTWSEYCDRDCIDVSNRAQTKKWMIAQGFFDPEPGERFVLPDPDEEIPDDLHAQYMEYSYETNDSPNAQAFHYLSSIGLGQSDRRDGEDDILASLEFVQGDCPGSNYTGVSTQDPEALSCLQQRLRQLDVNAQVIVT